MTDDLFRRLVIQTSTEQLTWRALLSILEIFYGPDGMRGSVATASVEPFRLEEGWDLLLLLDEETTVPVVFSSQDFTDIGAAKAVEVAAALTRAIRRVDAQAYAAVSVDPSGGGTSVKVYSGSLGLGSSVRVTGGMAQQALQFDTALTTYSGSAVGYDWVVTEPSPGRNRVSLTTTGLGNVNLSTVLAGDYVILQAANSTIAAAVYPVLAVGSNYAGADLTQWFEIPGTVGAHPFAQLSNAEISFYHPAKGTPFRTLGRTVSLVQTSDGLEVGLPATTMVVARDPTDASYLHVRDAVAVSSLVRVGRTVTVVTAQSHGMVVGDEFILDGAHAGSAGPGVSAGDGATTSDASLATVWTTTATQPESSARHQIVVGLNDGRVLVCGGDYDIYGIFYSESAQLFSITGSAAIGDGSRRYTYAWTDEGAYVTGTAFSGSAATLLPSDSAVPDSVLICGGFTGSAPGYSSISTAALYDPAPSGSGAGTWRATAPMGAARAFFAIAQATVGTSMVLAAGGGTVAGPALATAEYYSPDSGTWTTTGSMAVARQNHTLTALLDGTALAAGGYANDGSGLYHSSSEIFDAGTWSSSGRMACARINHTATRLPDGRVVVVGGSGYPATGAASPVPLAAAEIYDPASKRWSPAGKSSYPRTGHTAVYLPSKGLVLIAGGGVAQPEYWDPTTMTFHPVLQASGFYLSAVTGLALLTDPDSGNSLAYAGGVDSSTGAPLPSYLYAGGEDVFASGGVSGEFAVSRVAGDTEFDFESSSSGLLANTGTATVTRVRAPAGSTVLGPYVLDPSSGVPVTGVVTETAQDLQAGQQYDTLTVTTTAGFSSSGGWLCVGFGTSSEVDNVPYAGVLDDKTLLLDYRFRFPKTNLAGAPVMALGGRTPFVPAEAGLGLSYVTDSAAGRVAAVDALENAVAVGVGLRVVVKYPGDRGLGNSGYPDRGAVKLSDQIRVWGGDSLDAEVAAAEEG